LHSEEQKKIFLAIMSAESPNDAVKRLLQLVPRTNKKKNFVTTAVAVLLHISLQQSAFNPFYALVIARLCARCSCASWGRLEAEAEQPPLLGPLGSGRASVNQRRARGPCACLLPPDKEGKVFRRVTQRGLAAQNSAAHGFPLRRLLHLARLEAFLIRIGVVELRVTRFVSFEGEKGQADAHMGLSGKLGVFLKELCTELLCSPAFASVPLPGPSTASPLLPFLSLSALPDVREAFLLVLEDVLLPEARKNACSENGKGAKESVNAACMPGRQGKCVRLKGAMCTPACGIRKDVISRVIWFMKKQERYEEEDPNTFAFDA
ncbi:MA3 domain protein, partial [Toxoplasma gondii FOU]